MKCFVILFSFGIVPNTVAGSLILYRLAGSKISHITRCALVETQIGGCVDKAGVMMFQKRRFCVINPIGSTNDVSYLITQEYVIIIIVWRDSDLCKGQQSGKFF